MSGLLAKIDVVGRVHEPSLTCPVCHAPHNPMPHSHIQPIHGCDQGACRVIGAIHHVAILPDAKHLHRSGHAHEAGCALAELNMIYFVRFQKTF
jgi:hypothetical protein